jgi:hypothetical protein
MAIELNRDLGVHVRDGAPGTPVHALFTAMGARYTAAADLTLYDAMQAAYSSRL